MKSDGGQGENFHPTRGFHRLLVNVLGRNEQGDVATSLPELFRDGESRKEMPASPAAGDGDEGRFGFRNDHVALAAKGFSGCPKNGSDFLSRTGAKRATLNKMPTQASIARRFEPP